MVVELLLKAQFKRAGDAVVAADLGAAIAAAERSTPEIELLRQEQRTRRDLACSGELHRPGIGDGLVAGEPEIQRREFFGRAVARQEVVALVRGAEDVEPLSPQHGQIIGAAKIILQPVVGGQVEGADLVVIDRAEHVALGHIAETGRRGER